MINLIVLGLIFELVGALLIVLGTIAGPRHSKQFGREWWKRYYWIGWRPILRIRPPSEKSYWMIKPKHTGLRFGVIPPQHLRSIIGSILLLIGVMLQITIYLF